MTPATAEDPSRVTTCILTAAVAVLALVPGCATSGSPPAAVAAPAVAPVDSIRLITPAGGRLDWYRGRAHELIAYDAVVDARRRDTQVFTMKPDGTSVTCVTCKAPLPRGFIGQPAWHPDGAHLVVQAESENSRHGLFNHMAWGINNDLWLVSRDGHRAERIWRTPPNHGALHPQFDATGRRLMFAERVATGEVIGGRWLERVGAGGENQWAGWRVHIADVDLSQSGTAILSNHRVLFATQPGFYETHEFAGADRIVFSHTEGGQPYVDDIFIATDEGAGRRALIRSPATWDEHGSFSPSGGALAFVSSRADPSWRFPGSDVRTLRTELFLKAGDRTVQITDFNRLRDDGRRYLVSDFAQAPRRSPHRRAGGAGHRPAAQHPVTRDLDDHLFGAAVRWRGRGACRASCHAALRYVNVPPARCG
ncbi:MAG: hypothetical protein JSU82_13130 [Rhodospirillales bacterium]|nr:MAG: hypothetical protein JSU82_13130 [Rhodospirillales bacterium]